MNADNQMDPDELLELVTPVALDEVDYTKANRLFTGEAWNLIPHYRYLGNALLSLLTKIASGYWHVADSQAGYTAINRRDARARSTSTTSIRATATRTTCSCTSTCGRRASATSRRVRSTAIGEQSGIKLRSVVPRISWLLMKGFFWRMGHRYVIRDFHPLVFFYMAGFFSCLIGIALASYAVGGHFSGTRRTPAPRSSSR